MSDFDPARQPAPPSPAPRSGCLTAFMVVIGIILLLPGLCAVIFAGFALKAPNNLDPGITSFIVMGLLAGGAGVMVIVWAFRRPR